MLWYYVLALKRNVFVIFIDQRDPDPEKLDKRRNGCYNTPIKLVKMREGGRIRMADCFDVLGIARGASVQDVRRAYRELARRWHPDRFAEGPERLWAESKMININLAYEEALSQCASHGRLDQLSPENEQLEDVRKLLGLGHLSAARHALMRVATRSAEWNYLFGAVLFRLGEVEKAVLYFGIATRQQPGNAQYQTAYESAEAMRSRNRRPRFFWQNPK